MRIKKFFLQMICLFFFLAILTLNNPSLSTETGKDPATVSEFRLSIKTKNSSFTNEEFSLYIKSHKDEIDKYLDNLSYFEQKITSDTITLKELDSNDVDSIEILRFDLFSGRMRWIHNNPYKNREIIKGFLSLCKKATKYVGPKSVNWFLDTNYILVVNLKNKKTLEIPYSLSLSSPLGLQFESKELCEALCAMTNGFKGSMIYFDQGIIVNVTKFSTTLQPNDNYQVEIILPAPKSKNILKMDDEGKLFLTLERKLENGKVVMNETKPFHYGQAQIFDYQGPGNMIVYIEHPSDDS